MPIANPHTHHNVESEKPSDLIHKDDLTALLIAARFAVTLLHARVIIALGGIGGGEVQR
jgi:hypothetical protein